MSLKAKLEAVIYASEEPVTLTQLAALFAADALEWKAQQEAAAAEQTAEIAEGAVQPLSFIEEGLENIGFPIDETEAEQDTETPREEPEAAAAPPVETPDIVVADAAGVPPEEPAPAAGEPVDAEGDARREARQRDREIKAILKQLLDEIIAAYEADDRGVEIREIAGGYRMATKPECHDAVRLFVKSLKPALKLSLPALETLAVVAYKQPVTAPEVSEIRGVESGGVLGSLLSRKLIATAGRKQVIGRPILYKTTKEFLLRFGLKDLSELPSMEEFEKMAAAEIEEMEPEAAEAEAAAGAEAIAAAETAVPEDAPEHASGPAAQTELLEEDSPSGQEMAGVEELASAEPAPEANEPAEEAEPAKTIAETEPQQNGEIDSEPATAVEPSSTSNEPETAATIIAEEAAPEAGEPTPAEIEAAHHAQEEEGR